MQQNALRIKIGQANVASTMFTYVSSIDSSKFELKFHNDLSTDSGLSLHKLLTKAATYTSQEERIKH